MILVVWVVVTFIILFLGINLIAWAVGQNPWQHNAREVPLLLIAAIAEVVLFHCPDKSDKQAEDVYTRFPDNRLGLLF